MNLLFHQTIVLLDLILLVILVWKIVNCYFDYRHGNYEGMKIYLAEMDWSILLNCDDVLEVWSESPASTTHTPILAIFLSNRKQRVPVNGALSDITYVTSGVSQGSDLGHVLFLLYINDINENVSGKEFVDIVYDGRVFHNCYEIHDWAVSGLGDVALCAASVALSVCVNSYFAPQPRGALDGATLTCILSLKWRPLSSATAVKIARKIRL